MLQQFYSIYVHIYIYTHTYIYIYIYKTTIVVIISSRFSASEEEILKGEGSERSD